LLALRILNIIIHKTYWIHAVVDGNQPCPLSEDKRDKAFQSKNVQNVDCSVVVDYITVTKTHSTDEHKIDKKLDMAIPSVPQQDHNSG